MWIVGVSMAISFDSLQKGVGSKKEILKNKLKLAFLRLIVPNYQICIHAAKLT
jgi:hypothetical protein